ncbi:hypothetical protein ACFX1S_025369 [Malus domestica]
MLGIMMLGGIITSKPYARENGVSQVAHLLVVRYAHRTPRSSSGHLPFLSKRDFLRQLRMVLLDNSAYPFPYEYRGMDMCCLMPYFLKNFTESLPTNCKPLSVTMKCGMPKQQMMVFHMKCFMPVWVVVVTTRNF